MELNVFGIFFVCYIKTQMFAHCKQWNSHVAIKGQKA